MTYTVSSGTLNPTQLNSTTYYSIIDFQAKLGAKTQFKKTQTATKLQYKNLSSTYYTHIDTSA